MPKGSHCTTIASRVMVLLWAFTLIATAGVLAEQAAGIKSIYSVGEVVTYKDLIITLNTAVLDKDKLRANFTVKNNGNKTVRCNFMTFAAKDGEGQKLDVSVLGVESPLSDAESQDVSKGNLEWKVAKGGAFKIYFSPDGLIGDTKIVWQVDDNGGGEASQSQAKSAMSAPKTAASSTSDLSGTHSLGEIVAYKTLTITLNSAAFNGGKLTANFTVKNSGDKIVRCNFMTFAAKDGEGQKLDVSILGVESPLSDAESQDVSKGNLEWEAAKGGVFKIYFSPDGLIGDTKIVWLVDTNASTPQAKP